ncbi:MAG: hypothetical protein WCP65_01360 [Bacteroidota bacterium]
MKDKQFDNIFKDKLNSYSSPVPADMWERIAQDKRKKRPVAFWFTNTAYGLYALISILLITGGAFVWKHSDNNISNSIATNSSITNNNNSNANNHISKNSTKDNSTIKESNNNVVSSGVNSNPDKEISTSPKIESAENNNTIIESESKKAVVSEKVSSKKSIHNKTTLLLVKQPQIIGSKVASKSSNIADNQNSTISYKADAGNIVVEENTENIETKPLSELALVKSDRIKLALAKLNAAFKKPNHFDCPGDKNRQDRNWYLEVYGSPEYNFKSVTSNGTSSNYLQKKDSAETMLMGFNFGVRLMKNIFSNVYLKTGVQYSQYNEQFSIQRENEHITTTVIINKVINLPQGDTTISDTSTLTQVGYKYTKTVNQYRNIEIPVILSWRNEKVDNLWNWSLSGGVIINAYSWNNGSTIDTSLGIVSINSKGSNTYTSAIGVSLMAAASIERKLTDRWAIFTEPYFRYGLSNSIKSKFGFEQKFNSLGISLGVRLKLGNRQQY